MTIIVRGETAKAQTSEDKISEIGVSMISKYWVVLMT